MSQGSGDSSARPHPTPRYTPQDPGRIRRPPHRRASLKMHRRLITGTMKGDEAHLSAWSLRGLAPLLEPARWLLLCVLGSCSPSTPTSTAATHRLVSSRCPAITTLSSCQNDAVFATRPPSVKHGEAKVNGYRRALFWSPRC
ncbi:unnamed protein product [Gadus morhua 'NCC']